MAKVSINIIKEWFKNQSKPPQEQFYGWLDSFWHKDELIPQTAVKDLVSTLQKKADLVNGVIPENQLPFSVQSSEIIALGTISVTGNKVNLALHSSGVNKVRVNGQIITRNFPNEWTITPIIENGTKVLRVYALKDEVDFFLEEGPELPEIEEPEIPTGALELYKLTITLTGVVVEESTQGFREKNIDSWSPTYTGTGINVIEISNNSLRFKLFNLASGVQIGGFINFISEELYPGVPVSIKNNTLGDVEFVSHTSPNPYFIPIYAGDLPFSIKKGETANLAYHRVNGFEIIKTGGGADLPEGNTGDVLVKGATEWEASNRLTEVELDKANKADVAAALALKADLVDGFVPSSQLPSYVDDILEFADLASFPATGETGKIYVAISPKSKQYRWSGSTYIQITNGLIASTDDVPEGSNLYFTAERVSDKLDKPTADGAYAPLNHNHDTRYYTKPQVDTNIKTAVDNIEIGGRNLIAKTNLELGGRDDNGGLISTIEIIRTKTPISIEELANYTLSTYNRGIGHWRYDILFIHWTGYVISKLTVEKDAFFAIPNGCTSIHLNWYDDYKPLDLNWTLDNIKNKLEKGNKATDWTPAPEDVDALIAGKVDKPTTDGTWSLQKLGAVFTWVSGVVQNIANTDLTNISARIFTQGNTFTWNTNGQLHYLKGLLDKTGQAAYTKVVVVHPTTGEKVTRDFADPQATTLAVQNASAAQKTVMRVALLGTATPASPIINVVNTYYIKRNTFTMLILSGVNLVPLDPTSIWIQSGSYRVNAISYFALSAVGLQTFWAIPNDFPLGEYLVNLSFGAVTQGANIGKLVVVDEAILLGYNITALNTIIKFRDGYTPIANTFYFAGENTFSHKMYAVNYGGGFDGTDDSIMKTDNVFLGNSNSSWEIVIEITQLLFPGNGGSGPFPLLTMTETSNADFESSGQVFRNYNILYGFQAPVTAIRSATGSGSSINITPSDPKATIVIRKSGDILTTFILNPTNGSITSYVSTQIDVTKNYALALLNPRVTDTQRSHSFVFNASIYNQ